MSAGLQYPVAISRGPTGAIRASFPDLPGAEATGEYEADALGRAVHALTRALGDCIAHRRAIPAPSVAGGRPRVAVPALVETKVHLYEAMRGANIGKAELARRLKWHLPQVDRLLDVHHGSRLDRIEVAAAALGKRLTVRFDAAEPARRPSTRGRAESGRPPGNR